MALEAVNSVQLVLFVGEAAEPHGGFCWTAAPARVGDGVTDAAVSQPASIAAVIAQQLPGGVHLAHFGDLSTVLLTSPDCFIVGQLKGLDQVVEPTWEGRNTGVFRVLGQCSSNIKLFLVSY